MSASRQSSTLPLPTRRPPPYGARLRAARRARGLTAQQVAEAVGVTKGFIAQIERGEASPSVATLLRICDAIGLAVGSLFETPRSALVRADERARIDYGGTGVADWLLSPDTELPVQAILSEIAPGGGGGGELYTLSAELVFVFVLAGSLRVVMPDGIHQLGAGDAFTYSPREPHTWGNASQTEPATVLWIISPSPFGRR